MLLEEVVEAVLGIGTILDNVSLLGQNGLVLIDWIRMDCDGADQHGDEDGLSLDSWSPQRSVLQKIDRVCDDGALTARR